jgi:hypothetical protein
MKNSTVSSPFKPRPSRTWIKVKNSEGTRCQPRYPAHSAGVEDGIGWRAAEVRP